MDVTDFSFANHELCGAKSAGLSGHIWPGSYF
jgi:hypothetical protein